MQRVREQIGINSEIDRDGNGIVIGVLDTGIGHHPDLMGKVLEFHDFVGKRNLKYDNNGHGTHVCGIICGSGGISDGRYRGIAPGAKLVVGKVLDGKGDGSTKNMLEGLDWILQMREAYKIRILNISVGIGNLEEVTKEKALKEKIGQVWDSGILVVCAAGNKGPGDDTISGMGESKRVLTVGCHDGNYYKDAPWRCEAYSGRGKTDSSLRKPDLVAPGTNIISCNVQFYKRNGKYRDAYIAKSGTSMATSIVTGAAALVLQNYPEMTNEICKQKLQLSATDIGIPWNRQGWGMVNIKRLLK